MTAGWICPRCDKVWSPHVELCKTPTCSGAAKANEDACRQMLKDYGGYTVNLGPIRPIPLQTET